MLRQLEAYSSVPRADPRLCLAIILTLYFKFY